jgi:putative SOS response-associated peptidase YedK
MSVLVDEFHVSTISEQLFLPRFNVAPTQDIPVVRESEAGRELTWMRWGFIPPWAKDAKEGPLLLNARAETAAQKPAFRAAFKTTRCIIPADGFYEWKKSTGKKQPYLIHRVDGKPFGFAGLWSKWRDIESCTILTTDANELVRDMHDRMPVILSPKDYSAWLDTDRENLLEMLRPFPASEMAAVAVNPVVNNARNEGPECVEPII